MMNLSQTKLVGLTMELDLKAREYKILCDKLDNIKDNIINPNDDSLLEIKELFEKNHEEIININEKIRELKEKEETNQKDEQYSLENIFNKKTDSSKKIEKKEKSLVVQNKKNIIDRVIEKIKRFFKNS